MSAGAILGIGTATTGISPSAGSGPAAAAPPPEHGLLGGIGALVSEGVREGEGVVATVRHAAATAVNDAGQVAASVEHTAVAVSGRMGEAAAGVAHTVAHTVADTVAAARHGVDGAVEGLKHPIDPAPSIGRLTRDGDTATFSVNVGGKLQAPFFGSPVPWGPQAQYGFDAKVKRVAGSGPGDPSGYDVTFGKNLQAGVGAEEEVSGGKWGKGGPAVGPTVGGWANGLKLGAELNLGSADQVTLHVASQEDAARAVRLVEQTAVAQAVRDSKEAIDPALDPAHPLAALRNPLDGTRPLGAGDGGPMLHLGPAGAVAGLVLDPLVDAVADRLEPSAADTAFLRNHIQSYTTQLTGSARVGVEAKLGNFLAIQGRAQVAGRVSRTVTVPRDGRPGTVAYTLGGDATLDGREKGMLKAKVAQLGGAEAKATVSSIADLGKLTAEVTATYDMTPAQTALARRSGGEDVPGLFGPTQLANPGKVNVRLQGSVPIQNPFVPHRTDQAQVTLTADLVHPRQDIGALLHGLADGNAGAALARLNTDGRVKGEVARIERTGFNDTAELGLKVSGKFNAAVSAQVQVGTDHVADKRTWVEAGHLPEHAPATHREKGPVAPHEPSRV